MMLDVKFSLFSDSFKGTSLRNGANCVGVFWSKFQQFGIGFGDFIVDNRAS